jgi:hypothetical protein
MMQPLSGLRRTCAAVLAVVAVGLGAGSCSGGSSTGPSATSAATTPSTSAATRQNAADPSAGREDALAALLARRATALRTRDLAGFLATLDDPTSGFGLRQRALFDAVSKLPLAAFSYGTPQPAPALGAARVAEIGPQAWVSKVSGSYELAGFDTNPRSFEAYFTVVHRAAGWRLADDSDGGTQPQIWDIPSFTVLRSRTTLVVGEGPASRLRPYLALGDTAVPRVSRVWGTRWNAHVVLVVPGTIAQLGEQLSQDPASLAQVAAVTDGPFDATGRAGADRIFVNPHAFAGLQPRGQQVVVTHESTHVAIRSTTDRPVPLWLSEGMADFVGYRDAGASRQQVAAALLQRVRSGHGPTALPSAADFDPSRTTIAPSYNAAWLAVNRIVDRFGLPALVRFYRTAATSPDPSAPAGDPEANTAAAFVSVLHVSEASFTQDWLAYLRHLAAS